MLKKVPFAKLYKLCPADQPKKFIEIGDGRPCGDGGVTFSYLLMNEMAKVMTEDDIAGWGGINMEVCVMVVKLSLQHIYDVLDGALISVDKVFKKNPDLIPPGGAYITRDWEDIPDDQKAGHKE